MTKNNNRRIRLGTQFVMALVILVAYVVPVLASGTAANHKSGNMAVLYGITSVLALLLFIGCCRFVRHKSGWFVILYISVFVVNAGYLALSVSGSLQAAMIANGVSYFGSVFLPLSMLMIILQVCKLKIPRGVVIALCIVSVATFLLAASGDWLGLYYASVSVEYVNGIAILHKVYGPLHCWYLWYLLLYFAMMIAAIVTAAVKKRINTYRNAVILLSIVLGNIGVWYVEQLVNWDFEFLSLTYIISELLLLLIYDMLQDYELMKQAASLAAAKDAARLDAESPGKAHQQVTVTAERIQQILCHCPAVELLTTREREVLEYLLRDMPRKEIAESLYVTENTVKKHTSNIFFKLEVSNRRDLLTKLDASTPESAPVSCE